MLNLSVNLKKAYETESREVAKSLSRSVILYEIDEYWKQHLRDMDDLRQSVQNAAYEQKDPLVVYKLESYNLFSQMLEELNEAVLTFLLRAFIPLRDANEARQRGPRPASGHPAAPRPEPDAHQRSFPAHHQRRAEGPHPGPRGQARRPQRPLPLRLRPQVQELPRQGHRVDNNNYKIWLNQWNLSM